jgi:extradiol dioxygenase family protein
VNLNSLYNINFQSSMLSTSDNTDPTKKNAGNSGGCSLGTETDMRVVFTVFIHQLKQSFLHTSGKVVRCETLQNECHV